MDAPRRKLASEPAGVMGAAYAEARRRDATVIYRYHTRAQEAAAAIRRHLPTRVPMRVLDLGAADGRTMAAMADALPAGSTFLGVEYSVELVARANDLGPAFTVLQGDITRLADLPMQTGYHLVTALAVLEHLSQPILAMQGAADGLRSGGLFIASCPVPGWDAIASRLRLLPDHHETALSAGQMVALAQSAGLVTVETRPFMWAPIGILPYLGIPISSQRSSAVDRRVRRLRVLNWLFVDTLVVARKP